MLIHLPATFCGHRNRGRGDMFLICHMASCDHVAKSLCDFMVEAPHGKSPPCYVWWSLVWCKWRYVFNLSCDLARPLDIRVTFGKEPLKISHHPA